jgi:hypothetical protein
MTELVPAVARQRVYDPVCTVDGCDRPHKARGLCRAHFQRQLAHGDPGPAEIGRYGGGTCSVEGCERPAHSLGMCKKDYDRQRRGGRR